MKKTTFVLLMTVVLLGACKTPTDIAYLQDVKTNEAIQDAADKIKL